MKRILVYGLVGTNRGGIETFLLKMNSYMSDNTVFDYVVEGTECIHLKEIGKKGGKVFYIPNRHKHPFNNLRANKKLLKQKRNEYDSVYFNLSSLSWLGPIKIASKLNYKVFVHSHNAEFIKANGSVLYKILNKINKGILSKLNVFRLTCSLPATDFMFKSRDNVEMIYNAIDPYIFKFNSDTRKRLRKEMNLDECFVMGFVGRLQYQKNPMFLIEIAKDIYKEKKNIKLLVLGDGDMKNDLLSSIRKENLENVIILLGNVTNVSDYLQAFDSFVLPSRHEGLPYVVVEAQAAGLPCFLSDKITKEVQITGRLVFLPINQGPSIWKNNILKYSNSVPDKRVECFEIVEKSNFNIYNEAKRLEKILNDED